MNFNCPVSKMVVTNICSDAYPSAQQMFVTTILEKLGRAHV